VHNIQLRQELQEGDKSDEITELTDFNGLPPEREMRIILASVSFVVSGEPAHILKK